MKNQTPLNKKLINKLKSFLISSTSETFLNFSLKKKKKKLMFEDSQC